MRFYGISAILLSFMILICFMPNDVSAQNLPTLLECGSIIQSETTTSSSRYEIWYIQVYSINLKAGDAITLVITPLGPSTVTTVRILDPAGARLGTSGNSAPGQSTAIQDLVVGANGEYELIAYTNLVGEYTLTVKCVLKDGTVIEPVTSGDEISLPPPSFGFSGLPPVDFANAFRLPLTLGTASAGEIPTGGDAVLGFKFEAAGGDKLDLNFKRTSGNLNMGLVVLSADNKVAYMAALVTSETMSTTLTLPSSGEYTIGIFRIDLIPPASPEATGFEILAEKG